MFIENCTSFNYKLWSCIKSDCKKVSLKKNRFVLLPDVNFYILLPISISGVLQ